MMKDGDESQTVRDSIIAAMETNDDPVATTVETVAEPVQAESAVQADTGTVEEATEGRERDEKGRFKPKAEQAPTEVEAPEASEVDEPEQVAQPTDKKPPQALAASIKAKWGELPPEIKSEFIRLEQSSAKGVAKLQEEARVGRDLLGELEPYRALIQSSGGTPQTVIRNLLNTAAVLRIGTPAQKQQAVLSIINEYGVQMGQIAPQTEPHPLEREVQLLKQQLLEQQQTRKQQEDGQIMTVINQFLEEADEKGSLKHPLDESLEPEFADEIAAVRARNPGLGHREVLEMAYERMSWKVPEIRQTLLERQQAEAEAKRKEKAAQEVAKKQAAAVSLTGSAANAAASQPDSLRDLIASQVYGTSGRI
jgi:hypothetical protein